MHLLTSSQEMLPNWKNESSQEAPAKPPPTKRAKGEHKLLELLDDVVRVQLVLASALGVYS